MRRARVASQCGRATRLSVALGCSLPHGPLHTLRRRVPLCPPTARAAPARERRSHRNPHADQAGEASPAGCSSPAAKAACRAVCAQRRAAKSLGRAAATGQGVGSNLALAAPCGSQFWREAAPRCSSLPPAL